MKRRILGLGWLGLLLTAGFAGAGMPALSPPPAQPAVGLPEPPAGAIVFNLKYRGFNGNDEGLLASVLGAVSSPQDSSAFIAAVRKIVNEPAIYKVQDLKNRGLIALEMREGQPAAIYFDGNADGQISADEKILPFRNFDNLYTWDTHFITPDFWLTTAENREFLFRAWFHVKIFKQTKGLYLGWGPGCLLEGMAILNGKTATLNGKPVKLVLHPNGAQGQFDRFGQSAYVLLQGDQKPTFSSAFTGPEYVAPQCLSRLINYKEQFYRVSLQERQENGHPIRAVLEKDTRPVSELSVTLASKLPLYGGPQGNRIFWDQDSNVFFDYQRKIRLPAGAYRIQDSSIYYGRANPNEWRASFRDMPKFNLEPNTDLEISLGNPILKIKAIDDEQQFLQGGSTEKTVFYRNAIINFVPIIQGQHGERWGSFMHVQDEKGNPGFQAIAPTAKIIDARGKEIFSQTIRESGFIWDCGDVPPGRYTVTLSQETGPWARTITGELTITIQERPPSTR